jgi:uncharacterized membrane protein YhaH (DUF805 family)
MNQGMNPYQAPSAQSLSQGVDRDWKWLLFSFDGRARRGEYWKGTLLLVLLVFATVLAIAIPFGLSGLFEGDEPPLVFFIVLLLLMVPVFWSSLAISVKRWHDRGKSGAWVLIGLIPYIGSIWAFIECGCLRGTSGDNAYGSDPLA